MHELAEALRRDPAAPIEDTIFALSRALPSHLAGLLDNERLDSHDLLVLARQFGAVTAGELGWALGESLGQGPTPDLSDPGALMAALDRIRTVASRIPLGRAHEVVEKIQQRLASAEVLPVGSLRRFAATVGDIELLIVSDNPASILKAFIDLGSEGVLHQSAMKAVIALDRHEVTLRVARSSSAGAALVHYTGSTRHNAALRELARTRGLRFHPDGLFRDGQVPVTLADEAHFYGELGLDYIAPELREGAGEIEAARTGALPRLVTQDDIRGDLHMHSDWSDGRDSIDEMVQAAIALGYEYVAITDHSASSVATGLDVSKLRKQRDEVNRVRDEHPGITLLHGIEVDILPDGRLDLPDQELAELDVVLASLHEGAGQSTGELMKRYFMAMRHPLVHVITHPTNRLVGQHDGYILDVDALIDAAIETGTILEIDGGPSHLDMDGAIARRAIDAGALVSIDSDCHRFDRLGLQMRFGIGTARRGWVEAADVINARPLSELRIILDRKRG